MTAEPAPTRSTKRASTETNSSSTSTRFASGHQTRPVSATAAALPRSRKTLSTGEKAGIGVGVGIGTLAAVSALLLVLHNRRKQRTLQMTTSRSCLSETHTTNGFERSEPVEEYRKPELHGTSARQELAGDGEAICQEQSRVQGSDVQNLHL